MFTTYFLLLLSTFYLFLELLTNLHSKSVVYFHATSAQRSGFSDFVMFEKKGEPKSPGEMVNILLPRDPGSPSQNGFMEPKYLAFRFGDEGHPKLIL